jgi:hypothetical protein
MGFALAGGMSLFVRPARKEETDIDPEQRRDHRRAWKTIEHLNFKRTYTTVGWTGGLKATGLEMGSNSGLSRQRKQETLPELVARYRRFAATARPSATAGCWSRSTSWTS